MVVCVANRLAGKSVPELTYFVCSGTLSINPINLLGYWHQTASSKGTNVIGLAMDEARMRPVVDFPLLGSVL